jgi:hypothetical protein
LEGHEKGVNCVDYFSGGDRPYLITGADDKLVKVNFSLGLQTYAIAVSASAGPPGA